MADGIITLTDWATDQPTFIREKVLSIEPAIKRTRVTTASGKTFDVTETPAQAARLCWPATKGRIGLQPPDLEKADPTP
jgi:hypothetical protein